MVALLYLLIPFLGLGRAVSALRLVVLANFVAGAAGGGADSTAPQPPSVLFFFFRVFLHLFI